MTQMLWSHATCPLYMLSSSHLDNTEHERIGSTHSPEGGWDCGVRVVSYMKQPCKMNKQTPPGQGQTSL